MGALSTIEKLYTIALGLVALYLILSAPKAVNQILTSIGNFNIATFGVLQGRTVSGGSFSAGGPTLK
jgi:hypothetical protein